MFNFEAIPCSVYKCLKNYHGLTKDYQINNIVTIVMIGGDPLNQATTCGILSRVHWMDGKGDSNGSSKNLYLQ